MMPLYAAGLHAVFVVYAGLFLAAAAVDVWRFRIPNAVVLALAGLFAATSLALPLGTDWPGHLGAAGLVFAIGIGAWRLGVLGAGDVKLLAVSALWAGWAGLPALVLWVTLAGAGMALALLFVRRAVVAAALYAPQVVSVGRMPRLLLMGEGVPYGVAISVGAVGVAPSLPHFALVL